MRKRGDVGRASVPMASDGLGSGEDLKARRIAALRSDEKLRIAEMMPPGDPGMKIVERPGGGYRVTLAWSEEKFSPIPNSYSSCTAGPYSIAFDVPVGDDPIEAMSGHIRALTSFAEAERDRKLESFIAKLKAVAGGAR